MKPGSIDDEESDENDQKNGKCMQLVPISRAVIDN